MLTRYLHTVNLPLPGLIALSSPWCDFTASASRPNFPSQKENYRTDYVPYLGHLAIPSGTRYYTRESLRSVWFSPALASPGDWAFLKEGDVKVYIMRGTKELLAGEVEAVALGMKNDAVEVYLRDVSVSESAKMGLKGRKQKASKQLTSRTLMELMLDRQ